MSVSDADDDPISLQLSGGADQASFSLTDDGHLQFLQKAHFHPPSDQTRDNIYHVERNASDGIDRVSQDIEISVMQSVQVPEITTLVAGSFTVADTITIDSDTNDSTWLLVRNYQFDQAQITTNPSTILGYMNTRHQGPEGSLFATGDTHDVYQVSALGGEIINLTINAAEEADLDLYVYDMNGQIVSSSVGVDLYCRFKALYGLLILSNRAQRDPKDIEQSDGFRKYRNYGYQYIDNGHKLILRVHVDKRFN